MKQTREPMKARSLLCPPGLKEECAQALAFGIERTRENIGRFGKEFPHATDTAGRWQMLPAILPVDWEAPGRRMPHGNWTAGFWVGLLWIAYEESREKTFRNAALRWGEQLEPRKHDLTTQAVGFLFYPSFVRGYGISGDPHLRRAALRAADSLWRRYNPRARLIQAWGPLSHPELERWCNIDSMMNVPLLWWAYEETAQEIYRDVALGHSRTVGARLIRSDGASYHMGRFDPDSGEFLEGNTLQGLSPTSCWARGQAWALYGFTLAYGATHDARLLAIAEAAAEYFLKHLPPDKVPYWDFGLSPEARAPRDSSAGAIGASGLIELARVHPDAALVGRYWDSALGLLSAITRSCLSKSQAGQEGILLHGAYSVPHNEGVDSSVIWGDYYYLEALQKVTTLGVPGGP